MEIDPEVDHKEGAHRKQKVEKKSPITGLRIEIQGGGIIQEKDAATTFTEAIKQAGLIKVRNLGIKNCGINLVSTTKDKKIAECSKKGLHEEVIGEFYHKQGKIK